MKYFIGDQHWGHKGIIKSANRPFNNVYEMNEYMIDAWNSVVGIDDEVYHLGDMSYKIRPRTFEDILDRLNGKIYLIKGNHDNDKLLRRYTDRFEWVKDYYTFRYEHNGEEYTFYLFHYPIYSWNKMWYGSIQIHGHTHTNSMSFDRDNPGRSVNVSVEVVDYTPISITDIIDTMSKKKVIFPDKNYTINNIIKNMEVKDLTKLRNKIDDMLNNIQK